MHKTFFFGFLLLLLVSCNQGKENVEEDTSNYAISTENWPKKAEVNPKSAAILKDWPEFNAFDTSFDALYKVENTEDLNLAIEDLIEKHNVLQASEYPEAFDKPQIKSRQKVVHTFILKIKGHQEYRLDPLEPLLQMIDAYSIMRRQFDIITNNTLDIKTLLEDD